MMDWMSFFTACSLPWVIAGRAWLHRKGKPCAGYDVTCRVRPCQSPSWLRRRCDPLPPETVNRSREDEQTQSQTLAASGSGDADFALEESVKVPASGAGDDVQDLVDHMHDMVHSGRIDMDAYRGERSDDDEAGVFGPGGEDD